MNTLYIYTDNETLRDYYYAYQYNHKGDSGIDLIFPEDYHLKLHETRLLDFGIKCEMKDEKGNNISYYLYPRSSIYKTPLIMKNHVGIIDAGYRGKIMAPVHFHDNELKLRDYHLKKGERLFQICSPDLKPIQVKIVNNLSDSTRGEGGFGSTNV